MKYILAFFMMVLPLVGQTATWTNTTTTNVVGPYDQLVAGDTYLIEISVPAECLIEIQSLQHYTRGPNGQIVKVNISTTPSLPTSSANITFTAPTPGATPPDMLPDSIHIQYKIYCPSGSQVYTDWRSY